MKIFEKLNKKLKIRKDIIFYIKHPILYLQYRKAAKWMADDYMRYAKDSGILPDKNKNK
jgi:hypothetical protein